MFLSKSSNFKMGIFEKCIYLSGEIYFLCNKRYHGVPYFDFYKKITGKAPSESYINKHKKEIAILKNLTQERISCISLILKKFRISGYQALEHPHIFTMNPITMDNYGEVLKECGFIQLHPKYIIRYHTIVRSRTISWLKRKMLIPDNLIIEDHFKKSFDTWPSTKTLQPYSPELSTSLLQVRLKIIESYLNWRLGVTPEEFSKYCKKYLVIKHKPLADIQEAIRLAQDVLGFDSKFIRRNGFFIAADPVNTKLLINNVPKIADIPLNEVLRSVPAIIKNNYESVIKIKEILQKYNIQPEVQQRTLRLFCYCPETIEERLQELSNTKEFQVLSTNPRALYLVLYRKKMMSRVSKLQQANKQCYTLNYLISGSRVFSEYLNSFGDRSCGRDLGVMVCSLLNASDAHVVGESSPKLKEPPPPKGLATTPITPPAVRFVIEFLRRHKYWRHASPNVVHENINYLQTKFSNDVILKHCQILLYPTSEIQNLVNFYISLKGQKINCIETIKNKESCNSGITTPGVDYSRLSDEQLLSLILYTLEKNHYFTGDGIWDKTDPSRMTVKANNV